ncbi:MAG: hypothetical protein QW666_02005 [Candidatus Woesearchaeota archaeon]
MGSVYRICCKKCKVSLELDKAGCLIFEGIKDASTNTGKFNSNSFCNTRESKGIFSKEFFDRIDSKNFTCYEICHLLNAILFILEHKNHDLLMWQDEGLRALDISQWRKKRLDFEPFDDELFEYKKEE